MAPFELKSGPQNDQKHLARGPEGPAGSVESVSPSALFKVQNHHVALQLKTIHGTKHRAS